MRRRAGLPAPPPQVAHALTRAAVGGATKYTVVAGEAGLRQAIADDLRARKGLDYSAPEVVVSSGAK